MVSQLTDLTISQALDLLNTKEISSVELTQAHLAEMEKARFLNAYITETPELALQQAAESDKKRATGEKIGRLEGIPIANKDLYCTKGIRTTAASKILSHFVPPYESTVTQNLKDAGTVMLGKVNTDQFAMGGSTMTSYFGVTKNPWVDENGEYNLVPGGSSGGSAAAVAAGLCMGATGSDTGGSIRQPASFCGITGIKPTYGRCSRYGIVAFASSLDQAGPMARSVKDCALMLNEMAGFDVHDSTVADLPVPDFTQALQGDLKGKKIGIPKEYRSKDLNPAVAAVWDKGIEYLKNAGAEVVEISLPHTKYALPVYYIIACAEASSNLSRYDGVRYTTRVDGKSLDEMYENTRTDGFGPEVIRRILLGTFVLSAGFYDAYYIRAQRVRRLIYNDFIEAFKTVDAIVAPAAPTTALSYEAMKNMKPVDTYLGDVFTTPSSLAGVPSLALPIGLAENGLPVGLQVIGKHFDENTVFQVAQILEDEAQFVKTPHYVKG
ncbi:MAG: Asp-tRNA(Asn)/Glu-tRNA(Gln) amidotransferase subunit GatA [Alphaproteobacteria bacterium]|nr:Asp-tRNA(Asn)/Glu-tRNA(Gln) amidotransferase subunit GatA [Alphaproteobacteria bacterium]MBQ6855304.1 Asp-tRNA(Asn)/Glu-tRNA(Gln) amidotransferase subunit GatA [Alphaproteobacteria bacterium]MBQ8557326.1 Asp-tRNA(Asn)/Glu-tRNA(Gln) amidotransferase subunit GatA [Alphaproteobacteria bacterium]MBR3913088.1 Asp-tRNA(Asn)/Glu-tRNA(Gln) amidotransferase subunit GatA [Alphaproteobacteria bacterium]